MTQQKEAQQAWDAIAAGYDEFVTPTHSDVSERAVRFAGLEPGMRFLDVAAGTGALSISAARRGAEVLATDISPAMVERLDARAREAGLSNVQGRVMDGHALALEDGEFDMSGSQYGVTVLPDLPRALREMARVTGVGGRVLVVAFGPPEQVEFLTFFIGAMRRAVPGFEGLPTDPPPLPFQVAERDKLRDEMARAGLHDVRVETVTQRLEFRSAQELWQWVTNSHPIGAGLIDGITAEEEAKARRAMEGMLRERAGDNGAATLTHPAHIAVGVK